MNVSHRAKVGGISAIAAAAVVLGVVQGSGGVVGAADAKPAGSSASGTNSNSNRGPHKATPQKTTGGSSQSGAGRGSNTSTSQATNGSSSSHHVQNRGPNKTRPGDTAFNDDRARSGAEPDRGAHKTRPGDVSTSPRAQTNRGHADFRDKSPGVTSSTTTQPGSGSSSVPAANGDTAQLPVQSPAPHGGSAPATQSTEAPPASGPTRVRELPTVTRLGSVTSPQGLPSTVGLPDDSTSPTDYTRRYTPGTQYGPASPITFPAPGNRTSSWGPDPGVGAYGQVYKLGPGRVQLPAGSAPSEISGAPRNLKGVEVTAQTGTQIRISSATPTGQRQVRDAAGNTWTETTYRFDYQKRTSGSGGIGAIQVTHQGQWSDISPGEAQGLFDKGIPRPRALGGPTGGR